MGRIGKPTPPSADSNLDELWRWSVHADQDFWLQPQYRELLDDAEYFADRVSEHRGSSLAGRYARAGIMLAAAAVEAVSNDALVAIVDLLGDSWPSEAIHEPPWRYFRRLSYQRAERLMRRGSLEQKISYLLARAAHASTWWFDDEDDSQLRTLVKMRNRIAHMRSLMQPNKVTAVLNSKQVAHIGQKGVQAAKTYVDYLSDAFDQMKLPIMSFRRS